MDIDADTPDAASIGPWRRQFKYSTDKQAGRITEATVLAAGMDSMAVICRVDCDTGYDDVLKHNQRVIADTSMIAAAPELFQKLEQLVEQTYSFRSAYASNRVTEALEADVFAAMQNAMALVVDLRNETARQMQQEASRQKLYAEQAEKEAAERDEEKQRRHPKCEHPECDMKAEFLCSDLVTGTSYYELVKANRGYCYKHAIGRELVAIFEAPDVVRVGDLKPWHVYKMANVNTKARCLCVPLEGSTLLFHLNPTDRPPYAIHMGEPAAIVYGFVDLGPVKDYFNKAAKGEASEETTK